jgi:hypothetical protein
LSKPEERFKLMPAEAWKAIHSMFFPDDESECSESSEIARGIVKRTSKEVLSDEGGDSDCDGLMRL